MSLGDWELTITGAVARIDREDLDKSGKNPKYLLSIVITPDEAPPVPDGASLPAELAVRVKAIDLPRYTRETIERGDRVRTRARASGYRPSTLKLLALDKLT